MVSPFFSDEELVTIEKLPDWARPAFRGMKSLNRVQSKVSDTALYTGENMLVCAPTGMRLCARMQCRWCALYGSPRA
jgi:replicative superfamily II helicase